MKVSVHLTLFLLLFNLSPLKAIAQFYFPGYSETNIEEEGLAEVTVIGSGELQKSISQGQDIAASTGMGFMYWRIWPKEEGGVELQLDFVINVASTVSTIVAETENNNIINNRAFGSYLLAPAIAGQSTDINAVFYFKDESFSTTDKKGLRKYLTYIDGVQFSAFGASQLWSYDSTFEVSNLEEVEEVTITKNYNVSVFGWRAGFFYGFPPESDRREGGFSARLGLSYIGRAIQGDGGQKGSAAENMREKFLLNKRTTYHGVELGLVATYGNITAKAFVPIMHIGSRNAVPGLSGTQFITSIAFVGGLPWNLLNLR